MNLWDRLLPQTVLTLNLLHQSNIQLRQQSIQQQQDATSTNGLCGTSTQNQQSKRHMGANSTDGWYLRTSPEHYRCHVIYSKSTRSDRVSNTGHFKHKYITEPTLMPEDTLVKVLNDLTQALKEWRNKKGIEEMDALQQINELLNNIPAKATTTEHSKRVTFKAIAKPPQEMQPTTQKVANNTSIPRVVNAMPTPRAAKETPTPRVNTTRQSKVEAMIDKPILTKKARTQKKAVEETPSRARLKEYLQVAHNSRARIPQRDQMNPHGTTPTEQIQLIHNADTGEYLNYRQLM